MGHIRTIQMAVADYAPDEPRLILRCQVKADRVFDPAFARPALTSAVI